MNEAILWMCVAYVFLAGLLLLTLIQTSLNWGLKLVLVLVAAMFYWVSYTTWHNAQGWPSSAELPRKFLFHFAIVEEPSEKLGTKGQVFVWGTDLSANRPSNEPRAYVLPYGKDLHQKIDAGLRKIRNGNLQIGVIGGEEYDPAATRDNTRVADKQSSLEFKDLPDPQLPEK
ncbi:hypothetical protein NQT62_09360 [Limnobacter humi]|uniref:DUF4131 domain-containing protein n=1 Tax=Limnobacter humi TaxID=1778671 RepID=A0ABT1WGL0_9BURK|nr:hypothetical protein [Limnobacter humi]MCQ8896638.1 hypothetical protein [Limnobacter humi]